MSEQKAREFADENPSTAFGAQWSGAFEFAWEALAPKLIDYVYNPARKTAIRDYAALADYLSSSWKVACVEVDSTIQGTGPLKTTGRQLGRFSVRMLRILRSLQYYIVIYKESTAFEKRVALLHELGHLALHSEVFQSLGTLYHRICIKPALEFEIGRFITEPPGNKLIGIQELEADLFALTWLLPLGIDREASEMGVSGNIPQAFTPAGYKYRMLKGIFSERDESIVSPAKISGLNTLGEKAERRELSRDYPADGSLVDRLSWILFNRPRLLKSIKSERRKLMLGYFNVAGPPRYMPELKHGYDFSGKLQPDSRYAWIPRIESSDVLDQVDLEHWGPMLTSSETLPSYYIPITPVPSLNPTDSQVEWQNMAKANHSLPYHLSDWLTAAQRQKAGLLIFPRNPAEKILDQKKTFR